MDARVEAEDRDPIDLAVLAGLHDDASLKTCTQTAYQPFDPVTKRTEATVKGPDGAVFHAAKGAPQVIVALSKLEDVDRRPVVSRIMLRPCWASPPSLPPRLQARRAPPAPRPRRIMRKRSPPPCLRRRNRPRNSARSPRKGAECELTGE